MGVVEEEGVAEVEVVQVCLLCVHVGVVCMCVVGMCVGCMCVGCMCVGCMCACVLCVVGMWAGCLLAMVLDTVAGLWCGQCVLCDACVVMSFILRECCYEQAFIFIFHFSPTQQ